MSLSNVESNELQHQNPRNEDIEKETKNVIEREKWLYMELERKNRDIEKDGNDRD